MRFLLKAVFTLAMLAVLAFGAIAFLVPRDVVRDQAISLVKQQTGRDLAVRGETSFTFYPSVGVALSDVTLSNPPGMEGGPMLRMDSLTLNLKLLPLISRSVEVERFSLVRPVFDLRVDAKGRRNWDFAKKQAAAPAAARRNGDAAAARGPVFIQAQAGGLGGGLIQDISLGTIRIEDGVVLYANALDGASHRLDALNVSLQQDDLDQPLNADGDLVWKREKIEFQGQVGSLTALLRGGSSAISMALSSALGKCDFNGRAASRANALSAEGDLKGDTPSVRALADWTGSAMTPGKGFGPAKVAGHLKFQDQVLAFTKTTFSLDGMNGQGNGTVTLKGKKPYIRAAFAVDKLDLNIYAGPGEPAPLPRRTLQPPPAQPKPKALPQAAPKPKDGQSLTDFIEDLNKGGKKPEVRAWSQRAMDFAGLNTVNADVNFNAGAIFYQQIKTGAGAVSASLKKGVLTANLNKLALYDGTGTGRLTLNGARAVPAIALAVDLRGLSALPFMRAAMKIKRISGRAHLVFNVSGAGRTQSQMVTTLSGNGNLRFTNGAIEGINIPAMIRGLKQGRFAGWKTTEREKTDFSSLSGSFTMSNGIASNPDLSLIGPLLRMTGKGTIDVPREYLDYALTPRLVASLQGQGGETDREGIVIPVRVRGPWGNPKAVPDLKRILEDPELARDALEKAGKAVKGLKGKKITGEDVEQILQGVLGGGQQPQPAAPGEPAQAQPQQQQKVDPEELLKKFFKKR